MYFCALALSGQIFEKMPLGNAKHIVPYISHWQGEQYYRGLLQIEDTVKLGMLLDMSEQTKSVSEIDSEIKALVDDAGAGANVVPCSPPLAIMDVGAVPVSAAELERAHAITIAMMGGGGGDALAGELVGYLVTLPDGSSVKVNLDNNSHASGHRRGHSKTSITML